MFRLSRKYGVYFAKQYDGIKEGGSSLWAVRISKGYGCFPAKQDNDLQLGYTKEQIAMARKMRIIFYERLLDPNEIVNALYYSPVSLETDIYNSIFSDCNGVITMPDSDEKKLDIGHCFTVVGHTSEGFWVSSGWSDWGNKGIGFMPHEYLQNNFVTAFVPTLRLPNIEAKYRGYENRVRRKIKIRGKKWLLSIDIVVSVRLLSPPLYNIEICDGSGILAGWLHCSLDKDRTLEIFDLFVLKEYRRKGLGTFLINDITKVFFQAKEITMYIAGQDLVVDDREEIVRGFLIKNGYIPIVDRLKFRDCKYRIKKIIP